MYNITHNPQEKIRVTQVFGDRPGFYKRFGLNGHEGIDINQTPGVPTPVYACESGIIQLRKGGAYGKRININSFHLGMQFAYCHLSNIYVKHGQYVNCGDKIGMTGNTSSYSMPIHLHFMVREIDENNNILNSHNGYAGSIKITYNNEKFTIKNKVNKKPGNRIDYLYYGKQEKALYKGIRVIRKKQPLTRPKRIGAYNPYTNTIYLYDRALKRSQLDFNLLLEHEWSHMVYWKIFSKSEVAAWEKISKMETSVLVETKKFWNFKYWKNKYISIGETGTSEDFAETYEDIIKNPSKVYGDYRDIKRKAVRNLMARHGF